MGSVSEEQLEDLEVRMNELNERVEALEAPAAILSCLMLLATGVITKEKAIERFGEEAASSALMFLSELKK